MNDTSIPPVLEQGQSSTTADRQRRRIARRLGGGAVAAIALLVGFGAWLHISQAAGAQAVLQAREQSVPAVRSLIAQAESGPRVVELSGSIAPFERATIHARATGYISERRVDLGSKLHKGDVLAVIASPDLDQQLSQAQAQLTQQEAAVAQAQANAELGQVTNARTTKLVTDGWSSRQKGDQDRLNAASATAALAVAKANLVAQRAAVSRLQELVNFEQVTAPFDGVVTGRNIDVGSLVTADAASGTSLFSMAQTDTLRIQVYVPQSHHFGIADGVRATIVVPELPGRAFEGRVARSARVLADGTRTILTEVDIDNRSGELTAGLYCVTRFEERRTTPVIRIPSTAVIFSKQGLQAAVVKDGRIRLATLDLEADDGSEVEVRAGLRQGDQVVTNPTVGAVDGMLVRLTPGS
jgi:RND family efflux transporter MFP subunit